MRANWTAILTNMIVNFTKMHGLGNDFVVIDLITQGARLQKSHIKRIADRKFGIGCDQVILITPPTNSTADFFYKIFNPDGEEVEQCGNGARCAAKFFIDQCLTNKTELIADCLGGTAKLTLENNEQVSVTWKNNHSAVTTISFDQSNLPNTLYAISLGNPHAVCIVDNLNSTPIQDWGKTLSTHQKFSEGANIGFMQILNRQQIKLRVHERGAGLTLACGSGACAAVLVGIAQGLLDNQVTVMFEHGNLIINYIPEEYSIRMTGPAISVFIGRFKI